MRRSWVLPLCVLVAAVSPAAARAQEAAEGEAPSLEYRPPRPAVPEPRAPTPSPPVAVFREAIGGFGISAGSFDRPVDVAFGRDGSVYVLDAGNSRVQRFDGFGSFVGAWGSEGSRAGEFREPSAIAVDAEGAVYVADTGNDRIQKFDAEGRFLIGWGGLGSRSGFFKGPRDLALDGDGNVWVVDAGNERVQQFDPLGKALGEWGRTFGNRGGEFSELVSIAWSDEGFGRLYLLGPGCAVQLFERDGTHLATWSAVPPESGACVPARIEADNREDMLYLADAGNGLILKYTRDGRFLVALRGAARPFDGPQGLAVREDRGDFAVADTGNNLVQTFTLR